MRKARKDERHIGKLPPRYRFLLNPHPELRLSKCARCAKLTYPRKFPLFIHVDGWGPFVLRKTCKYCSRCESIMCSQHELEAELRHAFTNLKPEVIGNEYLVIGTVETKTWRAAMTGNQPNLAQGLEHLADFKKHDTLDYDPGGWRPADARRASSTGKGRPSTGANRRSARDQPVPRCRDAAAGETSASTSLNGTPVSAA